MVVPTSYSNVTEEELVSRGVNIVIYANHLIQCVSRYEEVAEMILRNGRAAEADDLCMPIKEILTLIPEEY